ncbi:alpha/beta hydrolase [Pseudovibrio exalbescens]|uniref:alpha/beta hydrolase n=1 Tax=Pseudovibrio exalbescens TaxID=197461 RepID=UPI000C9C2171|nr:alpha/beta hydrolase [Pseudovibrio exalbescens]
MRDWDKAYYNSGAVPEAEAIFAGWQTKAQEFRADCRGELSVAYGDTPRQSFDVFWPEETPRATMVFVHGGYWKAFDKENFSHFAGGAMQHGLCVAMPGYDLCPAVSIHQITRQIQRSIETIAKTCPGPIVLTGHSAGGHLVARMVCDDILFPASLRSRIKRIIGISGLYDLRPLCRTRMNDTLGLTAEEAHAESPVLSAPHEPCDLVAWVGADELSEFRRQTASLYNLWRGFDIRIEHHEAMDRNHFTVLDDLCDPGSQLMQTALAALV